MYHEDIEYLFIQVAAALLLVFGNKKGIALQGIKRHTYKNHIFGYYSKKSKHIK